MPLWRLRFLQVDHALPPAGLGTLDWERLQAPFQATLSPFGHLLNDPHPFLLGIRNQDLPSQEEMSCRLLRRREMPFLRPPISPVSSPEFPLCTNNRAGLSWMQGVAMYQMQRGNCPIVLQHLQFLAEPTLRFSRNLSLLRSTRFQSM